MTPECETQRIPISCRIRQRELASRVTGHGSAATRPVQRRRRHGMTDVASPEPIHLTDDERLLHRLGYKQELFRAMDAFRNFAISFTIISILAGCLTSYYLAFQWG